EEPAVALAVDVLDSELIALELVETFLRVGTGLRDIGAENRGLAGGVAIVLCPGGLAENVRRPRYRCQSGSALQHRSPADFRLGHLASSFERSNGSCSLL